MAHADTEIKDKIKVKHNLTPPPMYNVIYINDDVTTMEFVIESLMSIFNHTESSARLLTIKVHEDGSAVVAVLPYEIAEQKGVEATMLARNNGYPLLVKLEVA